MSALEHVDPTKATRVLGYVNQRTGDIVCPEHGTYDIQSPRSPWVALRPAGHVQPHASSTAPVICRECGAWLNDESTGYAIAAPHHDYWRRRLLRAGSRLHR